MLVQKYLNGYIEHLKNNFLLWVHRLLGLASAFYDLKRLDIKVDGSNPIADIFLLFHFFYGICAEFVL